MLVAWMGDNKKNDWTIGLKFVQFQKNSSLHAGIQRFPYMAMFGCDAKVGLSSSTLPTEILGRLQSEDELLALNIPQTSTLAQSSCDDDDQKQHQHQTSKIKDCNLKVRCQTQARVVTSPARIVRTSLRVTEKRPKLSKSNQKESLKVSSRIR